MKRPTCSSCSYRQGNQCHRFPPGAATPDGYPFIESGDWCGEHRARHRITTLPTQHATRGWRVTCACGWSEDHPAATITEAEAIGARHMQEADA